MVGSIARTVRARAKLFAPFNLTLVGLVFFGILIVNSSSEAFAISSTTTVSCTPNPVSTNQTTTCTATVTATTPPTPTGTATTVTCSETPLVVNEQTICTASVQDISGSSSIPTGTVTFSIINLLQAPGSRPSETLVDCLSDDSGSHETLFVNETATCTVTVKDKGPAPLSAPTGSVTITTSLGGSPFSSNTCGALTTGFGQSTCTFKYTRTSLALDGDIDTIGAIYNGDTTFAPSAGGFAQRVQRRTTSTTISCGNTPSCTATVTDVATRGTKSSPSGSLVKADSSMSTLCSSLTPSGPDSATCSFTVTISAIAVNVTAIYEPNDNVHIKSVGADNIITPAPTGPNGEKNIWEIRHALNSACLAANVAALALDALAIIIDQMPDPVVGVGEGTGVVAVEGDTIPVSDIISAVFDTAKVILQTFVLTACTDLDGDGLAGVIELDIGTSDANPDTDGDAFTDGGEIDFALGLFGGDPRACTDPTDEDSDDDGIRDGLEISPHQTEPCNEDTDGDGLTDGQERASSIDPTVANGFVASLPAAITWTTAFADVRDHSDPLMQDTDGDGISDDLEFTVGCGSTENDGYVNSFDSDADGLRDLEDAIADVAAASVNQTPVTPAPSNAGELNDDDIKGICDSDSDGDGLLDGEEFQIGSSITDWDTDNDGRGDREFLGEGPIPTDPFDFDTDDDGLGDGVEVFGANTTNPVNADTDGDSLCDGGANTPSFGIDGSGTNPLCSSGVSDNSVGQIGDHPNPNGFGEDENGNGMVDAGETDPNQFDTDGDAEGDGVEKLGFSTSRQFMIPAIDLRGRPINVFYPTTGCMNPLDPDTDDDGLEDGFEDFNHDGNWDFLPSDFDHEDPIPGPVRPEPEETNPCDADSDDDGLNDFLERNQPNPPAVSPFNPTNPLDHDTDNDLMFDGEEVFFVCAPAPAIPNLDNDGDGAIDEDPIDGIDNDLDGKIDEDKTDFTVLHIDFLDPTNRDSDSDGFIDGLDADPCNSPLIPILEPFQGVPPPDTDNDGFADQDELAAGTDPNDPASHPTAFPAADLDRDGEEDDRLWLEDPDKDGLADTVALDVNSNVQVDARIQVIHARDFAKADFDSDGAADDCRYKIVYAFSNQRVLQPRVLLTIFDFDCDLVIDRVEFESVK